LLVQQGLRMMVNASHQADEKLALAGRGVIPMLLKVLQVAPLLLVADSTVEEEPAEEPEVEEEKQQRQPQFGGNSPNKAASPTKKINSKK
jgi:rare lipoprotein A (peptidoglycan hydrolase)